MTTGPGRWDAVTVSAMLGAAVLGALFVVGKSARDALFLANFDPTALPAMVIGSSVFAIVLVMASSRTLAKKSPEAYVSALFAVSAVLLLALWPLTARLPRVAAPLLFLMVSSVGPMLSSGFWLIATDRFDPRSAKRNFGVIGAAGTIGGLLAGLAAAGVATRFGVGATVLLLAALNAAAAWQTRSWARLRAPTGPAAAEAAALPTRTGLRILLETPYLRNLAAIVLLGTIAAAFADYVFKVQARAVFADGSTLGGFLALYYAAVNLVSFIVQAFVSRPVLERFGLSAATSAPSLAFVTGGFAALVAPGFPIIVAMRGSEAVLRGSLLRSAYEIFYTPIASSDKRAVKAVVDVGVDRFGDILGFGAIQVLLWLAIDGRLATFVGLAIVCSLLTLAVTHRVSRGYVNALEQRLLNRAVELDVEDIGDWQTRTAAFKVLGAIQTTSIAVGETAGDPAMSRSAEGELRDLEALRSRNVNAALRVLRREDGISPALVPDAIRLLEWDAVAADALRALRVVAEEHVGGLIDALVDPNRPFAVRRRLARVCSVCVSQRAADGLLLGLEDLRFEVRFQSGRSLASIVERNPRVHIDAARVKSIVLREVAVNRQVWESRQLIDRVPEDERSALESLVGSRASRALEHVFTLLGLVLPSEPLRIAYRGLHSTDQGMRGTALEYLESVLPPETRERLWPLLEGGPASVGARRPREEILADLLRSNESILDLDPGRPRR